MKLVTKVIIGVAATLGVGVIGIVAGANARWDREREAPLPDIKASDDPTVIARGEYLVWGPAHCGGCHGAIDRIDEYEKEGKRIPLSGGFELPIPPATLRMPNITSHETAGIGAMSDGQIARSLRHGVARDGRMLFPIMPFQNLSDDDLTAIISYLRTLEPDATVREPTEFSMLGKVLLGFVMDPAGPTQEVPKSITPAPTAEYGSYLANSVANCNGCHTNRDLATGDPIGPPFAGGLALEHRGTVYNIPNITPKGAGSKLAAYDEAGFIERIRSRKPSADGSPMPWAPFADMSDDDLKAIYAYLQTVESVDNDVGPVVK